MPAPVVAQVAPAAPAALAPTSSQPTGASAEPALKLKPKLTDAPPAVEKTSAAGVSLSNWPTADIALSKGTGAPATSGAPAAASNAPSAPRVSIPPFPVVASSPTTAPIPKPVHLRAPASTPEKTAEVSAVEKPEQRPAFKAGVAIALAVVGLALCIGGFFAWKHFSKPAAAPASTKPISTPAASPVDPGTAPTAVTPAKPVESPTPKNSSPSTPREAANEEPVKLNLDQPSAEEQPAPTAPTPAAKAFSNTSAPISTTLAPGVVAKTGVTISNSGASPEFRAFVANAKISGVFQGENARAFINGRVLRVGELVDGKLGITFESIDAERKQIVFKDRSGAIATRKY
jgi:hypothetical protein